MKLLALAVVLLAAAPLHAQAPEPWDEEKHDEELFDGFYKVSTGFFTFANAGHLYLNYRLTEPRGFDRVWGLLAMGSGSAQLGVGAGGWSDRDTRPYAALNLAVGAATVAYGARTLLREHPANPLQRQLRVSGHEGVLSATPLTTSHGGVGLAATLRY